MKTAMQELIDDLKSVESEDFIKYGIIKRAEYYLEKEKEQIIDFANWYESGLTNIERWNKPIDEHYKDYLLFSRVINNQNK